MIIFMGVAGSGKSMQGRMLADALALPWLSTGEFLRMLISGKRRGHMLAGKLLGDKDIIELVRKIFNFIDSDKEFVLDGFPRSVPQADWLLNQVKHKQLNITAVIHLKATEATVRQRLLGRGRQDDTEEAIKERFREYHQTILPILDEFKSNGVRVCEVDGSRSIREVHAELLKLIKNLK